MNFFRSYDFDRGGEWAWRPSVCWWKGGINFSWELRLLHLAWKPDDKNIGEYTFRLVLNPFRWRILQEHSWYDGPICIYELGPFTFHRTQVGNCNHKDHD